MINMKKYEKMNRHELINVILLKNATIERLNGQVYYYKHSADYYKDRYKKEKQK